MNTTPLLFLFLIVPILALALLALNVLLAVHHPDEAKVSAYECGLPPILGQTRSTFQVHFFVVALLFLIFDVELLFLFPLVGNLNRVSLYGFSVAFVFLFVLTIGFVLEIGSGAISLNNLEVLNNKQNKIFKSQPKPETLSNLILVKPVKLERNSFLLGSHNFHTSSIINSNIINNSSSSSITNTSANYSAITSSNAIEGLDPRPFGDYG
jgi:NADH-ubiquinone oxidoreductase chain 3